MYFVLVSSVSYFFWLRAFLVIFFVLSFRSVNKLNILNLFHCLVARVFCVFFLFIHLQFNDFIFCYVTCTFGTC